MRIYLRVRKGQISKENLAKGKLRKDSLFLMYHDSENNRREYEWLKLHIYDKPKTELQKLHNKETWQLGESIKAQKVLEIQSRQHGFVSSVKGKIGFLTYFKTLVDKRFDSTGNHGNWHSTHLHLKRFCKGVDIQIDKVDDVFLERFKEYLLTQKLSKKPRNTRLSNNTALSYFNKVKTALKEAYQNKMLKENPCIGVKNIKEVETHRSFLTFEELQLLVKADCKCPLTKRAFIFSALTGLRFSDVQNLKWKNLNHDVTNGWSITYTQKKTKSNEVLPIGEQTAKLLGEPKGNDDCVFDGLIYSAYKNKHISQWVNNAGIDKHITFHCARHSFATLQLTMNTDIYTVSKMLGHRNLATTQIYAKVIDKKKIEAAARMPNLDL
jgi:integrase